LKDKLDNFARCKQEDKRNGFEIRRHPLLTQATFLSRQLCCPLFSQAINLFHLFVLHTNVLFSAYVSTLGTVVVRNYPFQ